MLKIYISVDQKRKKNIMSNNMFQIDTYSNVSGSAGCLLKLSSSFPYTHFIWDYVLKTALPRRSFTLFHRRLFTAFYCIFFAYVNFFSRLSTPVVCMCTVQYISLGAGLYISMGRGCTLACGRGDVQLVVIFLIREILSHINYLPIFFHVHNKINESIIINRCNNVHYKHFYLFP